MTKKQVIILIHGIGEQRPMETATAFARTIADDESISFRPSTFGLSGEINRISIAETRDRPRTDIYEYYWAHEFRDNQLSTIHNWFFHLFLSCVKKIIATRRRGFGAKLTPGPLMPKELLIVVLGIAYGFFWGSGIAALMWAAHSLTTLVGTLIVGTLLYKLVLGNLVFGYLADAAKYLSNHPDNVAARGRVRTGAIDLIRSLNQSDKYDRVMVIGHSLGSVIAMDAITQYWHEACVTIQLESNQEKGLMICYHQLLASMSPSVGKVDISIFQKRQREMRAALNVDKVRWKISDFVTVGSPLSFANFLVAKDEADFVFKRERTPQILLCPPTLEKDKNFYHKNIGTPLLRNYLLPTASSVFLYIRWTNIYGHKDMVGGAVAPLFGAGVFDLKAHSSSFLAAHTEYFNAKKGKIANQIKSALKLEVKLQT